jgi:hypothetical protein
MPTAEWRIEMGTILVELVRENKQRELFTTFHSLVVDDRLPVPSVGDTVIVWKGKKAKGVKVERRNFWYSDSSLHLQLFFTKTE